MDRIYFDQPDVDDREFGPERDLCPECGTDRTDDEHAVNCSHHPQFNEPDARDEHDSPIEWDYEDGGAL